MTGIRWNESPLYAYEKLRRLAVVSLMRLNTDTYLGIPHADGQRTAFDRLEENRLRPAPLADDEEELVDDDGGGGFGVQLADASDEHGPGHTAREAHNIRVDGASLRPELNGTEREFESALFWHEMEDLIGDAGAIEGTQLGLVQAAQKGGVFEILKVWRQLLLDDAREDQIYADAGVFELDDGDECVGDDGQVGNSALGSHVDEHLGEVFEVIIAGDVFGGDNERVDVGARSEHAQAKAAVREHLSARILDEDVVLGLPRFCDAFDELVADVLQGL